ncbi:MAG TPA: GntR family transcriptional regulator [Symbiobacteriaceae bacterium]|nr:GntR family transcriptional regulator [Symbiobacteriaceae bacterium]
MELNPRSPLPLYRQFKLLVEQKIASGEWAPEQPLPPEMQLIELYGISRITVRQAMDELVQEGRIYRRRGKGTFVAPPKINQTLAQLTGFVEELALRGLEPSVRVLGYEVEPEPRVAELLGTAGPLLQIRRLVSVGGAPLFADTSYFPSDLVHLLGREQIAVRPYYALLEAGGRAPAEGDQWLGAVALSVETAGYLELEPGSPGLAIHRVTKDALGRPVEYTRVVYRADRYEYQIRLERGVVRR